MVVLVLTGEAATGVHEDLSEEEAVGAKTKSTGEHHCELRGVEGRARGKVRGMSGNVGWLQVTRVGQVLVMSVRTALM